MVLLPHRLLIGVLLAATLGLYAVLAIWYPLGFIWATYEDLYGEWSQTYLFGISGVVFARLWFLGTRQRWFALFLAIACLYVFLEEISWGQRLLGFSSPEFFTRNNLQGETNVHNFFTGPYATALKDSIGYVVALGLASYGLLLPLGLRLRNRFAVWLDKWGMFFPPLSVSPLYLVAALLELGPFGFNEAEIAELLVGFALAATGSYYLVLARSNDGTDVAAEISRYQSKQFAGRLMMVLAVAAVLAVGTTTVLYASPEHRARIDRRIDNGIERFAERYRRYERWSTVVDLYERRLADEPDNSFLMRSIARAYREQGKDEEFTRYAARAIEVELERYAAEPWRASVLRSLVRGYRLVRDEPEADRYLSEALELGMASVEEDPDSANAAYSLGRTYALAGRDAEALEQYSRAVELQPDSAQFRQAYLSARD